MNSFRVTLLPIAMCNISEKVFDIFHNTKQANIESQNSLSIIKPIIAIPFQEEYKVIYGFQSVKLCREKNISQIPAFILPKQISFPKQILTVLDYVRQERELNPLEISKVISLIFANGFDLETISSRFSSILGIPPQRDIIQNYYSFKNILNDISLFLINKNAPPKMWITYSRLPEQAQMFLTKILSHTKPSLSVFFEISSNLTEISHRDEIGFDKIFQELDLLDILKKYQGKKALTDIRKKIHNTRYPVISKYREEIQKKIQKIKTPANLTILSDKTLETKNLRITCHIKTENDISNCLNFFKENKNKLANLQMNQSILMKGKNEKN